MTEPGSPGGPPTVGQPAWLADPTARHQLRWFDGTTFTDQVADAGVQSTDPGGPMPAGSLPAIRKTRRWPLVLAGVGVGAVLGAGAYLLIGGDDNGFGSFEGTVASEPGTHNISLSGGSVAIVRLDPSASLDAVVSFAVDDEAADRIEDLYKGTPFEEEATANAGKVFPVDLGFDGEDEVAFLAVPFGVDATVVVSGFDSSEGEYSIEIEKVALDGLDEDSDGDDVLDALVDSDDIPSRLRDAIEERLAE